MILRTLEPKDIPAFCALARKIYRTYYPGILSPGQIEFFLAHWYGEDHIAKQMKGSSVHTVAEVNGGIAGYASVKPDGEKSFFIGRLYVDTDLHGKGIGTALLEHIVNSLPKGGELRLEVNFRNVKALNYYFHRGFAIEKLIQTPVQAPSGTFTLEDYIMVKQL